MTLTNPTHVSRRWYDQDPLLAEVLHLLEGFEADLEPYAAGFIRKLEVALGPEAVAQLWQQAKPAKTGNRWYDKNPVLLKAIELLKLLPPEAQRQAAQGFLTALKSTNA